MHLSTLSLVTKKYEAMTNEQRLALVALAKTHNPDEDFYTIFDDIVVITITSDGSIVDTSYVASDR